MELRGTQCRPRQAGVGHDPLGGKLGPEVPEQRAVDAFFLAARGADFDALVALLDPELVARADVGAGRPATPTLMRGATAVAKQALRSALPTARLIPALVNGAAGVVVTVQGRPFAVLAFTVAAGKIVAIHAITDRERAGRAAAVLSGQ